MEMEMDIPLPDELEWLEANSHFPGYDDLEEVCPPEEEPQSPSNDSQSNGHKRPRSDDPHSLENEDGFLPNDEKRPKVDDVVQEIDEDWLRYSPRRETGAGDEEERVDVQVVVEEERDKFLSRYVSEIDGDFIPVTAPSGGDRVYAKICRVEKERSKKLDIGSQDKGLLSEPIDVLLRRVEQGAFTKALQASSESQTDAILPENQPVHEQLWVEKYAPNSFTELLSDEQTNREVLLWLKQWDSCVFGSEIRSTSDEVLSALRRHSSATQHQKPSDSTFMRKNRGHGWTPGKYRHPANVNNENSNFRGTQGIWNKKSSPTGAPEQKILLLCGPPGLGKTTLAHVAAKHCGYRVVEVNASDDRSSSTIEAKILDAVQMDSVMADSKPKCLVIDEIDGALSDGRGAVEVILKMVSSERKPDDATEDVAKGEQSKRVSSKKGRKAASLLRPVICICNDLYAPALRPLRQVAKVHIFVQPTVNRVVSRLKYICNKEGMRTSSIALTALADYTECDIRSCLNTLQFLNSKKETLNVMEIGSQVVGRKDMSKGVFDIWKEIFQQKIVKHGRKSHGKCGSTANEWDVLHKLISNRGDYDVIFYGIHENILQLHYRDPLMQKTVKCFNNLGVFDLMHQYIMCTQQMPLYAYQPFIAITIHHLVAQVQKPSIEWPKSYQRHRTTLMEKMDILRSWQNRMPPYISRHLSTKSFVEDSISPLLHILSPVNLRPVALHLLSEKEKNDLSQLVSTMVSYCVTYKNAKSSKQEHEAALDSLPLSFYPPICDFIKFKGYSSGHYVLPLAMKQVLVHEVEKKMILQVNKSAHLVDECNKENLPSVKGKNSEKQPTKIERVATPAGATENGKITANPIECNPNGSSISTVLDSSNRDSSNMNQKPQGNLKRPSNGAINFFERFRKTNAKGSETDGNTIQKQTTSERDSRHLLFKFNEGFTNAIKRTVRMREFL